MNRRDELVMLLLIVMVFVMGLVAGELSQHTNDLQMTLAWEQRRIPLCPEDSVLVGAGDYEAGQWDAYDCGPALDDYERKAQ